MTENEYPSIVVLTGAGISKESGLDTFRDADGIWARVGIDEVATPQAFARDPAKVHQFYNARRKRLLSGEIRPNAAHEALARLEAEWPGPVLVVTQNVDNLHERAGTRNLVHMHGEHLKVRCEGCQSVFAWEADLDVRTACPECGSRGGVRPHVVWFGELPFEMERIYRALEACGLFIAVGTSGNVYPAAGFVQQVRFAGRATTVELNLEPSETASEFHISTYGAATEVVPDFVDQLLALEADGPIDFRRQLIRR
jgi:NAD-dependent deacetylase